MSQNVILALQSFLIFLQIVNAGIASVPGWSSPQVQLILAAAVGAFQFFVTHMANQTTPEK